jgi:8-oxo-dGTP pyrophosphatase MutT (NUDIX family)
MPDQKSVTQNNLGGGIPENAKLVFKGIIFEVWQWEQKLFDGSTATFEKIRRPDTVEVIAITPDGKIIAENQEQPGRYAKFMSLPGGRADGGQSPLEEIKRELLEETGYAGDDWETLETIQPFMDSDYRVHLFISRNVEKIAEQCQEKGEKIELKFITFEELLKLPDNPRFRSRELANILIRARFDREFSDNLRKRILGKVK